MADIKVKVIPDTKELDKELKKRRTFTGLLGFGGGAPAGDKESKKETKKTNSILGKLLKIVSISAIVATLLSGLFKLLKPFVELFTALSFLVFFPLWKKLRPVLEGLSKLTKKTAEKGGGVTGLIRSGREVAGEAFEEKSLFERIGVAILVGLVAVLAIVVIGITTAIGLIPALIIAAVVGIVTLLILAWEPIKKFLGIIAKAFKDFWSDMKKAFNITVEFFKRLGKSVSDFFMGAMRFIVDGIKTAFGFVVNALISLANGIITVFNKIPLVPDIPLIGSFQTGGVIPQTGLALVHKGETVIPAGGGFGNVTQNITIQATINNDLDIRRLAERLAELSKDELARSTGSQRF